MRTDDDLNDPPQPGGGAPAEAPPAEGPPVAAPGRRESFVLPVERDRMRAAVQDILDAPPERLGQRAFLLDAVRRVGIPFNTWGNMAGLQDCQNASTVGLIQLPSEYVDFLLLLRGRRIRSFCEIGIDRGGFAAVTAAYLLRCCGLEEYHCVDPVDAFVDRDHYAGLLPLRFHIPATSCDLAGRSFDAVFIDGDHSYGWVKRDFINLGRHARICVFHDIRGHEYDHLDGGVVRFWAEVKESYRDRCSILELAHSGPYWMGIGVMLRDEPIRQP